jgi:hypothetical protein
MVILLLIIGIAILIYASIMWIKFVWFVFTPKKKPTNPYIEAQKTIMDNDKNYEEYIEWMSKNGSGVPVDKIKHKEEQDIEKGVNQSVFRIFK